MKKNKSKYLSLYERVRNDIVSGVFAKNSKLPSKRTMADEYGVSVITVEHAYELLAEEGYIQSEEKKGYFVIYSPDVFFDVAPDKKTRSLPVEQPFVKKYPGKFENNEISYTQYARMTRRVLSVYGEKLTEKSPGFGTEHFRQVLAGYLNKG